MAIYGSYAPEIIVHEVRVGSTFNGARSNGTLEAIGVGAPYYLGRANFFEDGTEGGLINSNDQIGMSLDSLAFKGLGTTRAQLFLVDEGYPSNTPASVESLIFDTNNTATHLGTVDPTSFVYIPMRPIFVPPECKLKLVTTGALTGLGRASFRLAGGWGVKHLQNING